MLWLWAEQKKIRQMVYCNQFGLRGNKCLWTTCHQKWRQGSLFMPVHGARLYFVEVCRMSPRCANSVSYQDFSAGMSVIFSSLFVLLTQAVCCIFPKTSANMFSIASLNGFLYLYISIGNFCRIVQDHQRSLVHRGLLNPSLWKGYQQFFWQLM